VRLQQKEQKEMALIPLLLLGLAAGGALALEYEWVTQDLPPRKQWGSNYGYCGETSVVAAMLKYGSYMSQWDVRDVSVLYDPRNDQQHWYSVGTNDQIASTKLRLNFNEFPSYDPKSTTQQYYLWLKEQTKNGAAVTMCVFMNHFLFSGGKNDDPEYGFHYYDHIVSVAKISSNYDDGLYHGDDVITFSDHGLWSPMGEPVYYFSYTFDEFCGNRTSSNSPDGPIYTMPCDLKQPRMMNFGIAHTGPRDDSNELVPVVVSTNVNYEKPEPFPRSSERPAPMPLVLTVTVGSIHLKAGSQYILYRYNEESKVPFSDFNKAGGAVQHWDFVAEAGKDYFMTLDIMSDQKAFFRCVRRDAP
jgi:hypothetical protein